MSKPETITIDDVKYVRADSIKETPKLSARVLVRCRNAGVHVGTLEKHDNIVLLLSNANRIWRWRGAHDLSYVAMNGVNRKDYTRISCLVPEIALTSSDVCEIIPVAEGVDLTEVGIDHD
jgi:hypothetical protein